MRGKDPTLVPGCSDHTWSSRYRGLKCYGDVSHFTIFNYSDQVMELVRCFTVF